MNQEQKPCVVCKRPSSQSPYCSYHNVALQKLRDQYPKWKNADPGISWERYLESVSKLEETGQWTAEVARNELKQQQKR